MRETPVFHELDRDECIAVLDRNHIGRIAYTFRDRVDITALSYVYHEGWLYIRTEVGDKLVTMAHNRWVAFEVDEIESLFDWRSVVARGAIYHLHPEERPKEHRLAVKLLRTLIPETFRAKDPVPFRDMVLRIHVDKVRGRAASTS